MSPDVLGLEELRAARARIAGLIHRTPLVSASLLDARFGLRLHFKAELFQKTGSFKVRGVLNKLTQLTAAERERGLVSMSAGNHAAALAYGAAACGTHATIVMPARAVRSKVEATRAYGGEIVFTDGDLMQAVERIERERGALLIHPFDDLEIMAGHGTLGLEITEDLPDLEAVIVPVGGGGLIGGVAAAVKACQPSVRVIGVEPRAADAMSRALAAGHPVPIGHPRTVADGLAAPFAGERTLRHVQRFVDDMVRVGEAEIVDALRLVLTRTKLVAEPSAAAALAPLVAAADCLAGRRRVVVVLSGGNVDLGVLKEIL